MMTKTDIKQIWEKVHCKCQVFDILLLNIVDVSIENRTFADTRF